MESTGELASFAKVLALQERAVGQTQYLETEPRDQESRVASH